MWRQVDSKSASNALKARFNSLTELANIRLRDDESLTELCTRVEGVIQRIKALRPSGACTLEMLDDELSTMAMLRALPREEYASFISSVLVLNSLTKDAVLEAFRTEEIQRRAAAARAITCYLCDGDHRVPDCPSLQTARMHIKKDESGSKSKKSRGGKRGGKHAANANTTPKVEEGCDGPAVKAGTAVCRSTSSFSSPI